jgi:hypothetical protein
VALGYRLVLVLEKRRRADSVDPAHLRAQAPRLADLSADHALEQPLGIHALARAATRPALRIGHPGRRHSDRARRQSFSNSSSATSGSRRSGSARSAPRLAPIAFASIPCSPARSTSISASGTSCAPRGSTRRAFSTGWSSTRSARSTESSRCIRILTIRGKDFWRTYGGGAYRALKARYDPDQNFPDLYSKCVLRH